MMGRSVHRQKNQNKERVLLCLRLERDFGHTLQLHSKEGSFATDLPTLGD